MIQLRNHSGTAVLRLDHGKAHALDLELATALRDALAEVEKDQDVHGAVLTGAGSIFCAGVDIVRLLNEGPSYVDRYVPIMVDMIVKQFRLPIPLVAAINGHAIAGGCVLAAGCDYRMMADGRGTIGVPELTVGLPFPLVALEVLRFATSEAHLQELVYRGKTYAVAEAYERGLVDEVVQPEDLLDRAIEVASQLGSEPSARFRITKRQLRQPTLDRMERYARETQEEVIAAWKDPVSLESVRRYLAGVKEERKGRE
jgi:enoyl-CoA hydratase